MVTRSSRILAFALAFAFFILAPPLLSQPFPPYPSIHWADVLDLLTPLVLIPLYWLLFTDSGRQVRARGAYVAFMILAALWVEGQAMHLGANSIGNLLGAGTSALHGLVHFYDEVLSHYLWHAAILGLSIVLLVLGAGAAASSAPVRWAIIVPASLLYGITCFLAFVEGGTVPLGLPATVLILVGTLIGARNRIRTHNLVGFFMLGYAITLILLAAWGIYWKGFPELTDVGLL